MTREEAITTLKEMHNSFDEIHENTNGEIGYEEMTAVHMAIEALSQPIVGVGRWGGLINTMTEKGKSHDRFHNRFLSWCMVRNSLHGNIDRRQV